MMSQTPKRTPGGSIDWLDAGVAIAFASVKTRDLAEVRAKCQLRIPRDSIWRELTSKTAPIVLPRDRVRSCDA